MKPRSCIAAAFTLALLMAGPVRAAAQWPEWVLNPPGGEPAGSDCVPSSGNLPIDRNQATARARLALAQQIEVKIEAMDETYDTRVREGKVEKLVSSFKSSSKQAVSLSLQGAKLVRSEEVKNKQGKFFCALVALPKETADKLPGDVIRTAGRGVDQETEALLLTKFRQVAAARAAPAGGVAVN